MSQTVVITGGAGFLGKAVVRELQKVHPEWQLAILDKQPVTELDLLRGNDIFRRVDITSAKEVHAAFNDIRPKAVIHCAAMIPEFQERYSRRLNKQVHAVNVEGTRHVFEAAQEHACEAFVYTSSCAAVTDDQSRQYAYINEEWPLSSPHSLIYGSSKAKAEALLLGSSPSHMVMCILRPSPIYGENDTQLIPSLYACIAKKESPYRIGTGMNLWDFVFLDDIASAHLLALENLFATKTANRQVFCISNNEPITFREFSLAVWKEFGHIPPYEVGIPENLAWVMGYLAEWFSWLSGSPTTLSRGSVLDACSVRYSCSEKARKILGYRPRVGLEEGIRRSCQAHTRQLRKMQKLKPTADDFQPAKA